MGLIIIKNKEVLSLPFLRAAILKFVFDEEHMTLAEIEQMKNSMVHWYEHLEFCKETGKEHEDLEHRLKLFGAFLKDNENGNLNERKELFKRHGIDYKKRFGIVSPEQSDILKANQYLLKAKKENPEDYL